MSNRTEQKTDSSEISLVEHPVDRSLVSKVAWAERQLDECCDLLSPGDAPAGALPVELSRRLERLQERLDRVLQRFPSPAHALRGLAESACSFADALAYPVILTGASGVVQHANAAALVLLEAEADEVAGVSVTEFFIAPEVRIADVLNGSAMFSSGCAGTIQTARGDEFPATVYAAVLGGKGEQVQIQWTFFFNVLEEGHKAALRESQQRFLQLFESAPMAMVVCSPHDGRVIDVNNAFSALAGYSQADLQAASKALEGILDIEGGRRVEGLFAGPMGIPVPARLLTLRGEAFPVSVTAHRIELGSESCGLVTIQDERKGLDPEMQGWHKTNEQLRRRLKARTLEFFDSMEMMRDEIVERKQAEHQLKQERDFISAVLDTVGALVIVTDLQGRVVRFNRASEELTSRAFPDVQGKCLWDLFMTPREGQILRQSFEKLKSDDAPQELETYWTVGRQARRMIYWKLTLLERGAASSSFVIASGIDITEQRAMGIELRHAEKMAALGRVASGIAHEVGNPLASMSARLQRMKERRDAEFLDESIPLLLDQIDRMTRIIRSVSTFSRPRGREWGRCDVAQILEETVRILTLDPRAANISIDREIPYSLPPIFGSQDQLQQAFLNIGINALDAMPEGGEFGIKAFATLDDICVNFADTGAGMPQEVREKLFDPFFTTKPYGLGTGLGLALTYNYIESHAGRITVDSEEGKGTVFRVFIPRREPPDQAKLEKDQ